MFFGSAMLFSPTVAFMCLDLVLERWQSFLFQICVYFALFFSSDGQNVTASPHYAPPDRGDAGLYEEVLLEVFLHANDAGGW